MSPRRRDARLDEAPPEFLEVTVLSQGGSEWLLLSFPAGPTDGQTAVLSDAEREVASRLCDGQSQAQIALARGTAPRTVANQISAIYRKLGVHSKAELMAVMASWLRRSETP